MRPKGAKPPLMTTIKAKKTEPEVSILGNTGDQEAIAEKIREAAESVYKNVIQRNVKDVVIRRRTVEDKPATRNCPLLTVTSHPVPQLISDPLAWTPIAASPVITKNQEPCSRSQESD